MTNNKNELATLVYEAVKRVKDEEINYDGAVIKIVWTEEKFKIDMYANSQHWPINGKWSSDLAKVIALEAVAIVYRKPGQFRSELFADIKLPE